MPNGDSRDDGHGGHQAGDCLWRQRAAGEPDEDEDGCRRQSNHHHTIGDMAGARRTQERHRCQVQGRTAAHMRTSIAMAVSGCDLKKKQAGSDRMTLAVQCR